MTDSFLHKGLRKKLVEIIQQKGIKNQRVLDAVGIVKRHLFVENFLDKRAYVDEALPIGAGQTISQP
ncbi:MAG TPA: protein-L-isoaspartate O-methyltransferase, partial [Bacteroidales bacterium]|nr:protein-L-isoaspartate O-methyltransferase [Bacteroidales bacterium]